MHKKLKGALNLNALASVALMFVIVTIVLSMGGRILSDVEEDACPYTWATANMFNASSVAVNPLTNNYLGCCQTIANISERNCSVWYTGSTALNATYQGTEGIGTFADWMPLLAIIIISVIVITMLMGGFGKGLGVGRA